MGEDGAIEVPDLTGEYVSGYPDIPMTPEELAALKKIEMGTVI